MLQARVILHSLNLRRLVQQEPTGYRECSSWLLRHSCPGERARPSSNGFHTSAVSSGDAASTSESEDSIIITYIDKNNKDHTVLAPIGKNLLEIAHDNEVDLEGACECSLACSTCHVIVEVGSLVSEFQIPDFVFLAAGRTFLGRWRPKYGMAYGRWPRVVGLVAAGPLVTGQKNEEYYKNLPEPSEDELDMLDLAFGLCNTSRLGCQIIASKELDGLRVRIPTMTRNLSADNQAAK